jgi:hypothetical protein
VTNVDRIVPQCDQYGRPAMDGQSPPAGTSVPSQTQQNRWLPGMHPPPWAIVQAHSTLGRRTSLGLRFTCVAQTWPTTGFRHLALPGLVWVGWVAEGSAVSVGGGEDGLRPCGIETGTRDYEHSRGASGRSLAAENLERSKPSARLGDDSRQRCRPVDASTRPHSGPQPMKSEGPSA